MRLAVTLSKGKNKVASATQLLIIIIKYSRMLAFFGV